MKIELNNKSKLFATIIRVTREDGVKFKIYKVGKLYDVYREGVFTGYTFRNLEKALEYCE